MWFKVTINKDGSVASCEQTDASYESGKTVRYVEADSREQALGIVAQWQRELENARTKNQKYHREIRARGICSGCRKRPAEKDRASCELCLAKHRKYARDYYHGRRTPGLPPQEERVARYKAARDAKMQKMAQREGGSYQYARAVVRRDLLAEVLEKFDSMPATAFRAWLAAESEAANAARPPQKKAAWRDLAAQGAAE